MVVWSIWGSLWRGVGGCPTRPTRIVSDVIASENWRCIMAGVNRLCVLHNRYRSKKTTLFGNKLVTFTECKQLSRYAQKWAEHMASQDRLVKSSLDTIYDLGYSKAGEIVIEGPRDGNELMSIISSSYMYRRNLYNSSFDSIGCGFATSRTGKRYWCCCYGKKS